jgi:hypothetical protein
MRLIFALCLTGLAAPSFAADPPNPNYYPLAKGTKWEYRLSADDKEYAIACEIVETEIKDGKTLARMEARLPNAVTLGEELSTDAKGVYRNAILGAKLAQPFPIIKYPVKARDTWKDKIRLGEFEGTAAIVVKDIAAVIEVPAGKFTTLAIESIVEINGEKVVACIWYANGVGIVKQETTCGSKMLTMELKKFSPSKP